MKIPKPVVYVFAIIGAAFVALNVYMSSGLVRSCDVTGLAVTASPNTEHEAKLLIKKCNYESSPMVVLNISSKANPKQEFETTVGIASTSDFDLTWVSDHKLQLSYPQSFEPTQMSPYLDEIEIVWKLKPISNNPLNTDAPKDGAPVS